MIYKYTVKSVSLCAAKVNSSPECCFTLLAQLLTTSMATVIPTKLENEQSRFTLNCLLTSMRGSRWFCKVVIRQRYLNAG